jgi:hypothetical protein
LPTSNVSTRTPGIRNKTLRKIFDNTFGRVSSVVSEFRNRITKKNTGQVVPIDLSKKSVSPKPKSVSPIIDENDIEFNLDNSSPTKTRRRRNRVGPIEQLKTPIFDSLKKQKHQPPTLPENIEELKTVITQTKKHHK